MCLLRLRYTGKAIPKNKYNTFIDKKSSKKLSTMFGWSVDFSFSGKIYLLISVCLRFVSNQLISIQSCLTFNCGKFAIIEIAIMY